MKNMMLFLMALLMSGHMMAQQTIVTGVITDANDGSPLIEPMFWLKVPEPVLLPMWTVSIVLTSQMVRMYWSFRV